MSQVEKIVIADAPLRLQDVVEADLEFLLKNDKFLVGVSLLAMRP